MQLNNSENWKQDLINHGVAIIDLTQKSGSMIYCGEQSNTGGNFINKPIEDYRIFKFVSNEPKSDIRLFCSLIKTDDQHYSLYYKFERDNYVTKEISRINVFCYDLWEYVKADLSEFEVEFEEKYNELYDICSEIKNNG